MTAHSEEIVEMTRRLACLIAQQAANGADLSRQIVSVSTPKFRILYVPAGEEAGAKAELNETLR